MRLTGKTRDELAAALADKSRAELLELIFSLVTFERLLSVREIAQASRVCPRDVSAAMKAGAFIDPIHGRGFFCRGSHSLKVSASAANAWRRSFFVSVPELPADSIPPLKKESGQWIEDENGKLDWDTSVQIGVEPMNLRQKRATIRALSPSFLGSK